MNNKLGLLLLVAISITACLEAATLRGSDANTNPVVIKLDYAGVEANASSARQAYSEDDSDEDSDEDDEEDDAELQHQAAIRNEQAYEQSVNDSQENSDEHSEDNFDEDADANEYFGRRIRRDVTEAVTSNEVEKTTTPAVVADNADKQPAAETSSASTTPNSTPPNVSNSPDSSNTSVLILIRDAIKKVTEIPNTQQVATSAQQYFQLFQHFLQETIKQVIGDDDDEEGEEPEPEAEAETPTIAPETDKEPITETSSNNNKTDTNAITSESVTETISNSDKVDTNEISSESVTETISNSDKVDTNEIISDKESSVDHKLPQTEKVSEEVHENKF